MTAPEFLNTKQAAAHLGLEVETLRHWRMTRRTDRPQPVLVGRRLRWYTADLDAWVNGQLETHRRAEAERQARQSTVDLYVVAS